MSDYDVIRLKRCPRVGWKKKDNPLKKPCANCRNRVHGRGSPIVGCAFTPSVAHYLEKEKIIYKWNTRFLCVLQTKKAQEIIEKIENERKRNKK